MAHERALIRHAAKAQIEAYGSLPSDPHNPLLVHVNRHTPFDAGELPAIAIYTPEEEANEDTYQNAPRLIERDLVLQIDVIHNCIENLADETDAICLHVEDAIASDETLGGLVADCIYLKTTCEFAVSGDRAIETASLRFGVNYHTSRPDNSDDLDNFDQANIKFNLRNEQPEGDQAENVVSDLWEEE